MQIAELSASIDQKLSDLEQQLSALQEKYAQTQEPEQRRQIAVDITTLQKIKLKLLKSKDIAWRAHQLQEETEIRQRRDQQQRLLGLSLCVFSGIAALMLVGVYFWSGLF